MKNILFLFSTLIICLNGFSSDVQGPKTLSFQLGSSIPTGTYAASNSYQNGYATKGSTFHLEYTNYSCNRLGWSLVMTSANHKVNNGKIQEQLNQQLGNNQTPFQIENNGAKWMSSNVMAGAAYRIPLGKFSWETKAYIGFFFAKNPNLDVISGSYPIYKFDNNEAECVGSLGAMVNSSINYYLSPKWALKLSGCFYHAKPTYKKEIKIAEVPTTVQFQQEVTAVEIVFGLSYNFRKNNK